MFQKNYNIYEVEELRSGVLINNNNLFTYKPFQSEFQHGPGLVINMLDNNNMFVFGGLKNDLPSIQGAWNSQPFIISEYNKENIVIDCFCSINISFYLAI